MSKDFQHSDIHKSFGINRFLNAVLLVGVMMLGSSRISAQSALVSISFRDTTVEAILREIGTQTDLDFIYNHEELEKCPKVSVSVSGETVEEVLRQCLQNSGLSYEKVNNTIIITPVKKEKRGRASSDIPTQTIRGQVTDRDSRSPLPFASVVLLNSNPMLGTTTDDNGLFQLDNIPVGRHSIQVSYVGYRDAVLSEILLGSAKEEVLSIEIAESTESIGEVSVSFKKGEPLNSMATVSSRSFSVEETKRYPVSISDPARMAQVFAGVSITDDAKNEIVIRGNSPNWMLWRLEGIEIPSPNHFAEEGYTSGAVSILSTNMIGVSDFYTGAFPAEYGNALSGVFDIKFRNGNSHKNEFTVQAGLLGIDLSAEGPFKKGYGGSYLFNYRYSTFSILDNLNIEVSQNALPVYQDLSFKINLPTKKAGTFSFWGIGGFSHDDEKYLPDTTTETRLESGYRDFTKTAMYATGVSHTIFPDERSYLKTILSHSMSYSSETLERMDSRGGLNMYLFDSLQTSALRISSLYNRKISSRLTVRTGLIVNLLDYNYYSQQRDEAGNLQEFLNSDGHTNLFQGYVQTKYKLSDQLIFSGGLHYAYFALSNDHSLEPRLGLTLELPGSQKLSFGYSHHSKNENLPVYFVEIEQPDGSISMPNLALKMTRSTHYIVAYDRMLGPDLNMKVEAYYQHISNLPVPNNPEKYWSPAFGGLFPNDTLTNLGVGRNYGLEFTFQKFFTNSYYFLVTSSIYDSKFKTAFDEWFNTRFSSNYINNFVGGKEFKWGESRLFGINGKIIWSGGKRMIPIDLPASIEEGEGVYKTDELYTIKTKDYFRFDVGLKLHFFKKKSTHVISLDIQNLTNRKNVWTEVYNPETQSLVDYTMTGFIPIFNYRVEF
ncbi:MAG: TonB-dependent receptor [Bacteroidetes bacterium]|nr:TonB-dependent receptor [Bacteroidota bacterium]